MDILYSSSDSYAFLTGISILSLLENNRECDAIHIYIMDNHISDINKNKLIEVVKEYRRDISFVPMPDMKELTGQEIDTRRWNISTFGRLYMASALPETVHKVLNIDCDTIIVDTIEPLWNTDMTGKVFGGMLECINDRYRRNVGKNDGDYYLNGGIVFLNLDEVRVGNYERKFTDYITKYGSSLAYLDQDVLNGVVEQEKKVKLPMRYNTLSIYFYATYEQVLKIRRSKSQDFYSKEEFSEAISNPGLVHFTTCFLDGLRPWIKGNQHPYLKTFLSTIARTTIAGAIINVLVNLALIRFIGLYAASISTLVSYASTALYRRIDIRKYIKIKVNVKNILLNSVAVVFVTLSYYFNITILNVAALVIACIYAVGINWKLIKMFFAEIRKYKKEGN